MKKMDKTIKKGKRSQFFCYFLMIISLHYCNIWQKFPLASDRFLGSMNKILIV